MHREIQIKQFPIVTTHWWPKTRNERFVWENQQYLYRFLPLVHNHVQVIWVHTHPVCDVCVCVTCVCVCVTCVCVCVRRVCVCARSGSRCIHTGRRRQRLMEGVSEAWCWRAVIVTTTNHILLWCCMNGIGYLHEGDLIGWRLRWRLKVASAPRFDTPSVKRWRRRPVWMQREPERAHTHTRHTHTHTRHTHTRHTHTHTRHTPDVCAHSDHLDMVVYKR